MAAAKEAFGLLFGQSRAKLGDARDLRGAGLDDASVDAVVTSPPYSLALDYVKNDEHALQAMGVDTAGARDCFIGVRGEGAKTKLQLYEEDMRAALAEISRVLRRGGKAVVVIGDATVDGEEQRTVQDMLQWAEAVGLRHEGSMPKVVYGLYNVIADEKILFFRRG